MQGHCDIGAKILLEGLDHVEPFLEWLESLPPEPLKMSSPLLDMAATIARTHHEKWDGSGYPAGIVGAKIPLVGRIVAIADVYDALLSVRPYKPALSEDKVLSIMDGLNGQQFDPDLYDVFQKNLDEFRAIRAKFRD